MLTPFLDIHSHHSSSDQEVFRIQNHIVGQDKLDPTKICTAGIHPWYISTDLDKQLQSLHSIANRPNVIAIGECGLDKNCSTDWNLQLTAFQRQIKVANKLNKPLLLHSVRAYQEITAVLKLEQARTPVLFHGFNKKTQLALDLLKKGYYLSLGAHILQGTMDELIGQIPLDKLFLETDNSAITIVEIFSYFCATRKIPLDSLKQQMLQNFEFVFKCNIKE